MYFVVALIVRDGRILVERRSAASRHSPGAFRFPAGHVEAGEALEAALEREVNEELSRRVLSCRKLREADFTGQDGLRRRLHYFLVALDAPAPEGEPWRWFDRAQGQSMDFPVDRELFRELV
jgi:8-oxo-dGTP diphosphatase